MEKMLTQSEIRQWLGLSESGLHKMRRRGDFPEPVRIGARAIRWPQSEVEKWLRERPRASG